VEKAKGSAFVYFENGWRLADGNQMKPTSRSNEGEGMEEQTKEPAIDVMHGDSGGSMASFSPGSLACNQKPA